MRVTLQEVARHAGVSTATVSRVLNEKRHVSQKTRDRVLAAIQELGYQPDHVARSLRRERSTIIGLIITDIENPFFTSLVRAVEDAAYKESYAVFLCNSDEDIKKEELYIDLMRSERVAGVVIVPAHEKGTPCHKLIEAGIPVVAVDRHIRDLDLDTVVVDNRQATERVVGHMIEQGHQQVGTICGPRQCTTGRERREGYVAAVERHGLPVKSTLVVSGPPTEAFGFEAAYQMLTSADPPTALFLGNNLLFLGALRATRTLGLRIPEDVAVGCFDYLASMPYLGIPVEVVVQPTYELGRTAAELLLRRIGDRSRPLQEVVLKTTIRECGP